jgi:hypothetical protein
MTASSGESVYILQSVNLLLTVTSLAGIAELLRHRERYAQYLRFSCILQRYVPSHEPAWIVP